MTLTAIAPDNPTFRNSLQVRPALHDACRAAASPIVCRCIGRSEQGRDILGVTLGSGPRRVSLIAGNHADEPVGPETLRHFVAAAATDPGSLGDLLERFTCVVVPHVNPDGEAANEPWMTEWPDPLAYMKHAVREPPGRDVEFGYPDPSRGLGPLRTENHHVAAFLAEHGPFDLHMSLHGMAVADGAWLLIDRHWIDRTEPLRDAWLGAIAAESLDPFDWDRGGDKGFEYIGPGFSTTPRGEAMRDHFLAESDPATAALFHGSSMEYVRSLGGDPLCLVTELPLFVLSGDPPPARQPGVPSLYLRFKQLLPRLRLMLERGEAPAALIDELDGITLEPLPLATAIRLQLRAIELGLEAIED